MPKVSSLTFVCCFLVSLLVSVPHVAASGQFIENFDDGSYDGWVIVNDPNRTACFSPWIVTNGMLGIAINQSSCTTNIMPTDALWNNLGDNYIFELDIKFVSGTDH